MKDIDFISLAKFSIIATVVTLIVAFFIIIFIPINKSLEFTGGLVYEIDANKNIDLHKEFPNATIHKNEENRFVLKFLPSDESYKNIQNVGTVQSSSFIAPSFTNKLTKKSVFAVIFSVLAIFIYIFLRFNFYYGLGAIITIVHDVILSFAFVKIIGIEFGISTIAAILTIIGYSINDTVIIYDKIRSNLTTKSDFFKTINTSVNETLPRTIGTSLTTILAIIPVVFFASGEIYSFCLIVAFGILVGTFSSIGVSALFLIPFRAKILQILDFKNKLD